MKLHLTTLQKTGLLMMSIMASSFLSQPLHASTLSGGLLTINLNRDALIAGVALDNYPNTPLQVPSIYLEEFFDASAANQSFLEIRDSLTPTDLFDVAANEISAANLQFPVNGAAIPANPLGRSNQSTNFKFNPADVLGSATGNIGLNGVLRFRIDVKPPSNRIMLGDMSLAYDPELEGATPGRSGWVITNHIGFDAGAFELFNVTTALNGNILNLNGNLGFGDGFDHLGAGAARANAAVIGDFSFQATVVPVPGAVWLFLGGAVNILWLGRRRSA
jgi:hypothetical protein